MILCATSLMALIPASKEPPECAAFPYTVHSENTPPLRPVTTLPVGRPGSELNTARAPRAVFSMMSRQAGEPISSSDVISMRSGAGAPPNFAKPAITKAFMTTPAFMSATPGP